MKALSQKQSSNWATAYNAKLALLMLLSYVGFANATFLTVSHFHGSFVSCPIGWDCSAVLSGPFSSIAGVPVALLGAIYFGLFFMATAIELVSKSLNRRVLPALASVGFAVSLVLFGVQWLVIKSFCPYCLVSGAVATVMFLISLRLAKREELHDA